MIPDNPKLTPALEAALKQMEVIVKSAEEHLNNECVCLAKAWSAYLTEYVYESAKAKEAFDQGNPSLAAKHRLNATCHRARADRKQLEFRRAAKRLQDGAST